MKLIILKFQFGKVQILCFFLYRQLLIFSLFLQPGLAVPAGQTRECRFLAPFSVSLLFFLKKKAEAPKSEISQERTHTQPMIQKKNPQQIPREKHIYPFVYCLLLKSSHTSIHIFNQHFSTLQGHEVESPTTRLKLDINEARWS